MTTPASAQQTGLVNVSVGDATIQVPIVLAAYLCDVNANFLMTEVIDTGSAECDAVSD